MTFDRMLNAQAVIMRLTGTLDQYGNTENSYAPFGDPIPVRLDVNGSTENVDDRESTVQTGVVYTRSSAVENADLLSIDSVAWEVTGVPIPRFSPASLHHYEIPVRRAHA